MGVGFSRDKESERIPQAMIETRGSPPDCACFSKMSISFEISSFRVVAGFTMSFLKVRRCFCKS